MTKDDSLYRPCAGIMLLNCENKIFVGQRIDQTSTALQMPQGGIDLGETPKEAALRELEEEIGTKKAEILTQHSEVLYYDLPPDLAKKIWGGRYKGQRQYWFLMRFKGNEKDINLQTEHPEFSTYQWIESDELIPHAIAFKQEVYKMVLKEFKKYLIF